MTRAQRRLVTLGTKTLCVMLAISLSIPWGPVQILAHEHFNRSPAPVQPEGTLDGLLREMLALAQVGNVDALEAKVPQVQAHKTEVLAEIQAAFPLATTPLLVARHTTYKNQATGKFDTLLALLDDLPGSLGQLTSFLAASIPPEPELPLGQPPLPPPSPPSTIPMVDPTGGVPFPPAIGPATAEDLEPAPEGPLAPEIVELAASLENDPVRIYQHVVNAFAYEPYYGLRKGALGVLAEGGGNDADKAALLVALLRAAGVPARYVYHTGFVAAENLTKWLGVPNATAGIGLLAAAQVPHLPAYDDGVLIGAYVDRVWARAWLRFTPYLGAAEHPAVAHRWIDLDSGLSVRRVGEKRDLAGAVGFDPVGVLAGIQSSATVEADAVSNLPAGAIVTKMVATGNALAEHLVANGLSPQTAFRKTALRPYEAPHLPTGRQFQVQLPQGITFFFRSLPAAFAYKVELKVVNPDGTTSLGVTKPLYELVNRRLTVGFIPATADDETILAANADLFAFPAFLVDLRPVLAINGATVAQGTPIGMGRRLTLSAKFVGPVGLTSQTHETALTAGAPAALVLAAGAPGTKAVQTAQAALETAAPTPISAVGSYLHATGVNYLFQMDALAKAAAGASDVAISRDVSYALVGHDLAVGLVFGAPFEVSPRGIALDVVRLPYQPAPLLFFPDAAKRFRLSLGLAGSALENVALTQIFQAEALSAVRLLAQANGEGQKIFTVTQANVAAVLPQLSAHPGAVLADAENAVAAGRRVTISKSPVTLAGITASPLIVQTPETGAALFGFRVVSPTAGGLVPYTQVKPAALVVPGNYDGPLSTAKAHYLSLAAVKEELSTPFLPAALSLESWLSPNPIPDGLRMMAAVLAVSAPLTSAGSGPGIFGAKVTPEVSSGVVTISATVTQGATWTAKILNLQNQVVAEQSGTTPQASATFTLTVPDAKYAWRIEAVHPSSGVAATPRGGSFDLDKTAPAVAITSPAAGATLSGTAVVMTGTAADVNLAEYQVLVGSEVVFTSKASVTNQTLAVVQPRAFASGTYALTVSALDKAGNASTTSVEVLIDNPDPTPPSVAILSPAPGAVVGGVVNVQVGAADAGSGVAKLELFVDGVREAVTTLIPTAGPVQVAIPLDTRRFINCPHILTVRAVDAAGQVELSLPVLVYFQNVIQAFRTSVPAIFLAGTFQNTVTVTAVLSQALSWTIVVKNEAGQVVRSFGGFGTSVVAVWDGKDQFGVPVPPGIYTIELAAGGQTITATVEVLATAPEPVAVIHAPADFAEVIGKTPVVISTEDPFLSAWTLELVRPSTGEASILATGTTGVADFKATDLDPTLRENDNYELRLTATTASLFQVIDAVPISIVGEQKVGNVRLTFQDLVVPVGGIPITVTRTYDSFSGIGEDFGKSWKLDVVAGEVNEDAGKSALLTLPTGRRTKFTMTSFPLTPPFGDPPTFIAQIQYIPRRGSQMWTLEPIGGSMAFSIGGQLLSGVAQPFDPPGYILASQDGTQYRYEQEADELTPGGTGLGRLVSVRDTSGNQVVFEDELIQAFDPTGALREQVLIMRDPPGTGRVVAITDPEGQSITYGYTLDKLTSVTNRAMEVTQFVYTDGRLTSIIAPDGSEVLASQYGADGRIASHTDAFGNPIGFTHNVDAKVEVVTDRRGFPTEIHYDDEGFVTKQVDAQGNTQEFGYNEFMDRILERDALGNETLMTYDVDGNMLSRTDALGNTTLFTYNAQGLPTTITDPLGRVTTNIYDEQGHLLQTIGPLGDVTANHYNDKGELNETILANGARTLFNYNLAGYLALQTFLNEAGAPVRQEKFVYDQNGNRTLAQRYKFVSGQWVLHSQETFVYDAEGRLKKSYDPLGHLAETIYNDLGQVQFQIDKNGNVTEFVYNERGELVTIIYPPINGNVPTEQFEYDENGNRVLSIDRMGNPNSTEYDAVNRPMKVTNADGSVRETVYDAAGRVVAEIDERGYITQHNYDAAGRRVSTIDPLGNETKFEYDAAGQLVATIDAKGATTQFVYDAAGRQVKIINPDETERSFAYDSLGRKISETDENGLTKTYAYDFEGRLTAVTLPNNTTWHFLYDVFGNKVEQIDALSRHTGWTYTLRNEVASRTLPMGQTESFQYDPNGNQTIHTRFDGSLVTTTYNAHNLPTSRAFPGSRAYQWTYWPNGQKKTGTVVDPPNTFTWSFVYDARNRLAHEAKPDGTFIAYQYDAAGNRVKLTTPAQDLTYAFDALGRPISVSKPGGVLWASATWDENGNLASRSYVNGTRTEHAYNSRNQVLSIIHKRIATNEIFSSFAYTRDLTGKITQAVEAGEIVGSVNPNRTVAYSYDPGARLVSEHITSADATTHNIDYVLDAVGNRLSKTETKTSQPPQVTTYSVNANDELTFEQRPDATLSYSYTPLGETATIAASPGGATTFTWGFDSRLVAAMTPTASLAFRYDDTGIRHQRTENGAITNFLVDRVWPSDQVMEERNGAGTLTAAYACLDERASLESAGQAHFYQLDAQHSVRTLTDAAGELGDSYGYDAFGVSLQVSGTTPNSFRYVGEQLDEGLARYYARARWLDHPTARFASRDPLAGNGVAADELNSYSYVGHAAVNRRDPSGLFSIIEVIVVIVVLLILMSNWTPHRARDEVDARFLRQSAPVKDPIRGFYKDLEILFTAREGVDFQSTYVVVQWVSGSFTFNGQPVAITNPFLGITGREYEFDTWTVDAQTRHVQYPFLRHDKNRAFLPDAPGARPKNPGQRLPPGRYIADLEFYDMVYRIPREFMSSNIDVDYFSSPWSPYEPVGRIPWEFKDVYDAP